MLQITLLQDKSKTSTQVLNDEESSARNEQKESPGELVRSVEN